MWIEFLSKFEWTYCNMLIESRSAWDLYSSLQLNVALQGYPEDLGNFSLLPGLSVCRELSVHKVLKFHCLVSSVEFLLIMSSLVAYVNL